MKKEIELHNSPSSNNYDGLRDPHSSFFIIEGLSRKLLKKAKQIGFLMIVFLSFAPDKAFSQDNTSVASFDPASAGISSGELSLIIQNCIDLAELQKYYPVNTDNSLKQLNIVQLPISLPTDLSLTKDGQPVNLVSVSKDEFSSITLEAYSMFRSIQNLDNSIKVNFNYFYKSGDNTLKTLFVMVDFQKSDSGWNIISSNIGGDTL